MDRRRARLGASRFSKSVIGENEKTLGTRYSAIRQGQVKGPTSGEQNLGIDRAFSVQTKLEIIVHGYYPKNYGILSINQVLSTVSIIKYVVSIIKYVCMIVLTNQGF